MVTRRTPVRSAIVTCFVIALLAGSAQASLSDTLGRVPRIMPLGDSITAGGEGSYRRHLGEMLRSEGFGFDFVGSRSSGRMIDNEHEGHNGWWPRHLLHGHDREVSHGSLFDWLPVAKPDVVLLHVGSNGLSPDTLRYDASVEAYGSQVADVREILDVLYAHNPQVQVLVAKIIGRRDRSHLDDQINEFNRQLVAMVRSHGKGDQLTLVDMQGLLDHEPAYFSDAAHPSPLGHDLMALAWYPALAAILQTSDSELSDVPLPAGIWLVLSGLSMVGVASLTGRRRT